MRIWLAKFLGAVSLAACCACRQDMYDQAYREELEESTVFENDQSSRPRVEGTVAQGEGKYDPLLEQAISNGKIANELPMPLTRQLLTRGRERFEIYCTECHGRVGDGKGMVVQRGFSPPPSYHIERLRMMPVGYFVQVITNGYGTMYNYADRVDVADRWAVAAYVRTLQLSQYAPLEDVPFKERAALGVWP